MIAKLLEALRATSPLEAASVLLGLAYVVLAVRRSRLCWVMGGLSSAILVWLYGSTSLPMQSALNAYYVVMSFYGYATWGRTGGAAPVVGWLPLRGHVLGWLGILLVSGLTARLLAAETQAAWPYLDSLSTSMSLFATWLTARMRLENWLYWIAIDAVVAVLSAAQGLVSVALLYVAYLVIAGFGFAAWLRELRASPASAGAV